MNNRNVMILAGLLAAQLALAAALNLDSWRGTPNKEVAWFDLERDKVDSIELSDEKNTIKLVRNNGAWQLPDYHGLPADDDGIARIFDRISSANASMPVTTTASAHKRFKVADDDFERRIRFNSGDKTLATVHIGTGATRGRSHGRTSQDAAVREVQIASYELPVEAAQWADKSVVAVPRDQIAKVDIAGLSISAGGDGAANFKADGLSGDAALNEDTANKLMDALAQLRFETVLATEPKPEFGLAQPQFLAKVVKKQGGEREYRISKQREGNVYTLQLSDRKEVFQIGADQAEALLATAKRDSLVKAAAEVKQAAQGSEANRVAAQSK